MGQYVDAMAVSLQQWDIRYGTRTDLGLDHYKALSFGGLSYKGRDSSGQEISIDTDSFKQLVPNQSDRDKIKDEPRLNFLLQTLSITLRFKLYLEVYFPLSII
ncbi:MAG: hypothetical protein Q4A09_03575 [Capnocytophaga felis]|nr:hypothetical protein [Capnocytophaga felis]